MSLRLVPINAMLGLEVFMGTLQQQLDTLLWSKNIKAIKFKSKRSTPSRNREIKEAAMAESGGGSGSVPTRMPIEVELSVRTPVSDNDIILLVNPVAPVPFLIAGVGGIGGSGERRRDEKAGVEECKIQTPPRFFWSATPTPSQINLLQQYIYLQQQRRTYATRLTSAFDLMKQKARTMYQDEGQVPRHLPVLRPSIKFASKLAPIDEGGGHEEEVVPPLTAAPPPFLRSSIPSSSLVPLNSVKIDPLDDTISATVQSAVNVWTDGMEEKEEGQDTEQKEHKREIINGKRRREEQEQDPCCHHNHLQQYLALKHYFPATFLCANGALTGVEKTDARSIIMLLPPTLIWEMWAWVRQHPSFNGCLVVDVNEHGKFSWIEKKPELAACVIA